MELSGAPAEAAGRLLLDGETPLPRKGFGAMQLPGPGVWGAPRNRPVALAVLRRAVELGIRLIDTAASYAWPDPRVRGLATSPLPASRAQAAPDVRPRSWPPTSEPC